MYHAKPLKFQKQVNDQIDEKKTNKKKKKKCTEPSESEIEKLKEFHYKKKNYYDYFKVINNYIQKILSVILFMIIGKIVVDKGNEYHK